MQKASLTRLGVAIVLAMFENCSSMPCNESSKIWIWDGYGGKIYVDNPDCSTTSNGERKDQNIIRQQDLFCQLPCVLPAGCETIGGPDAGKPCVFPFKIDNVTYNGCTTEGPDNDDDTPRCSTAVDDKGNHEGGHWGYCGDGCPLQDTERGRNKIKSKWTIRTKD